LQGLAPIVGFRGEYGCEATLLVANGNAQPGNEHRRGATSRIRSPDLTSQPPRSIDTGEAITDHPSAAEVYRNVESEVWEAIGTNLC